MPRGMPNPFEYGETPIRDMTHAVAKRTVRLVKAIAEGRTDDRVVVEARGIILDIRHHRARRQHAERVAQNKLTEG